MNYLLKFNGAPGDVVVFSAFVRDLKLRLGAEARIDVITNQPDVFANNPHLFPLPPGSAQSFVFDYQPYMARYRGPHGIQQHFVSVFHQIFGESTGLHVPVTQFRPDLWLTEQQKEHSPVRGRYWLMLAGGKRDSTVKHWDFAWYQQVVDRLLESGIRVVQTGLARHVHPPLRNVLSLVGQGELTDFFQQVYHADGVICPITCAMHVAAAFNKPCVVIAGGREEPWWAEYSNRWWSVAAGAPPVSVPHQFLHTVGQLPCCLNRGCWAQKVIPSRQAPGDSICANRNSRPLGAQPLPECMARITPEMVIAAVQQYRTAAQPEPLTLAGLPPVKPLWKLQPGLASQWQSARLGSAVTFVLPADAERLLADIRRTVHPSRYRVLFATPTERPLAACLRLLPQVTTPYFVWLDGRSEIVTDDWLRHIAGVITKQQLPVTAFGRQTDGPDGETLDWTLVIGHTTAWLRAAELCAMPNVSDGDWLQQLLQLGGRFKRFNCRYELVQPGGVADELFG